MSYRERGNLEITVSIYPEFINLIKLNKLNSDQALTGSIRMLITNRNRILTGIPIKLTSKRPVANQ